MPRHYFDLYEDTIDIQDIKVLKKSSNNNPDQTQATVDFDGDKVLINDINDNTTVQDFLNKLMPAIAKSNIETWKGGQIKLDQKLQQHKNATLKSLFPSFPETIEFIINSGEHTQGVKPEDTPHVLSLNESHKYSFYLDKSQK